MIADPPGGTRPAATPRCYHGALLPPPRGRAAGATCSTIQTRTRTNWFSNSVSSRRSFSSASAIFFIPRALDSSPRGYACLTRGCLHQLRVQSAGESPSIPSAAPRPIHFVPVFFPVSQAFELNCDPAVIAAIDMVRGTVALVAMMTLRVLG